MGMGPITCTSLRDTLAAQFYLCETFPMSCQSMARSRKGLQGGCKVLPSLDTAFGWGRGDSPTCRGSPGPAELFSGGAASVSKAEGLWLWLSAGCCLAPGLTWGHAVV